MIGQIISHYKITAKLGEGGMGVVYRAEDTKLDRTVALKFIAANLIKDAEARKRFEREAKAAAGVSHANVCHVYEIAEAEGHSFLAMEFVEGESLDKRIERGPLPLKDALDIARQAAEGLAAAHEQGVVHRDIKPGNLLITPKAQVKILDFGLALLTEGSKLTQLDTKVGTVAYMSPEQAQGMEVDHRSDIWSLGCVLYEMVCGQRPFRGAYDQALLYEIVNQEPEPLTGLRTGVPMELEFIVGKCLAKDRNDRTGMAQEVARELRTLGDKLKSGRSTILRSQVVSQTMTPPPGVTTQSPAGPLVRFRVIENVEESADSIKYLAEDTQLQRSVSIRVLPQSSADQIERVQRRTRKVAFGAAGAGLLLALIFAFFPLFSPPPSPQTPLRRFAFTPPVAVATRDPFDISVAASPNGRHIAFVEAGLQGRLWVQDLDQPNPRVIEGTEGAVLPFWSPDSNFLGFGVGTELKKVPVQGGLASRICEAPGTHFHGPSWSPDGEVIVFGAGDPHGLYEVPARGGTPKLLIAPDEVEPSTGQPTGATYWTYFLPSEAGARVLVLVFRSASGEGMVLQDLGSGRREFLGPGAFPVYSPGGHLVYQPSSQENSLWAMPFSLKTLKATGEAFPIAGRSRHASVAADQTLVYLDATEIGRRQLVWIDRHGQNREEIPAARGLFFDPVLSPDDELVALSAIENGNEDVWVYDLARGSRTRLTTDPAVEGLPVWSPVGDQLAFGSLRATNSDIFLCQADGSGKEQVVADTPVRGHLSDWSRDGKYILYSRQAPGKAGYDLWYLERKEDGGGWEPHRLLEAPSDQTQARLSPDGRYFAYTSNESGRQEVYVEPFPEGGRKVTVSSGGGACARWRRDGKELFYVDGGTLVAVSVSGDSGFSIGSVARLFENPGLSQIAATSPYDVSVDGQRFILSEPVDASADAPKAAIRIVQNWHEEFRDREKAER